MNQPSAHRYEDKLLELAYGELPASEARSVEAHVKGCPRCSGALRDIEGVRRQMSQLGAEPAPDAGLESLLAYAQQTARRIQAGPEPKKGLRRLLFGVAGFASAAVVVAAVTTVTLRAKDEVPAPTAAFSEEAKAGRAEVAQAAAPQPVPAASPAAYREEQEQPPAQVQGQAQVQVERDGFAGGLGAPVTGTKVPLSKDKAERMQEVDVVPEPESLRKAADALDTRQDYVPGRGTRPVLPSGVSTSSAGLQRGKMAGPPAASPPPPPEMMLNRRPADLDNALSDTRIAGKQRSMKKSAPAAEDPLPAGSGGGFGEAKADRSAEEPASVAAGAVAARDEEATPEPAPPASPKPSPPRERAPSRAASAPQEGQELKLAARPASAIDWYTRANQARGTPSEPAFLEKAVDAGLSGNFRIDALQRLCLWFEKQQSVARAEDFCAEWNAMASSSSSKAAVSRVRATRMKQERARAVDEADTLPAAPAEPVKKAHSF